MTAGARVEDGGARGPATTVFVSDPSAEAERMAQALRGAGYLVVDVPLSMLVARVAVQHPRVVLVDADGEGALDAVTRLRELPDSEGIDVLFVARPGGAVGSAEEAIAHEGSGLFVRPVDVPALVRKVDALTGGAAEGDAARPSVPAPSAPSSKRRPSVPPSLAPASLRGSIVPSIVPETRSSAPPAPRSVRPSRAPSEPPVSAGALSRRVGLAAPVSPELASLLSAADERVQASGDGDSIVPSPEDEIEAVLPADLLASLDEPLEEDDDEDEMSFMARSSSPTTGTREPTNDGGGPRTTGAASTGGGPTTGAAQASGGAAKPMTGEIALTPPPAHTHGGTHAGSTGAGVSTTGGSERRERADVPPPAPQPARDDRSPSVPPPTAWSPSSPPEAKAPPARGDDAPFPAVLGPGDAERVVARAIATRTTGSLCFAAPDAERRVVLREGDVVTAASTAEDESLLAFLGARGDLPRETVRRLGTNFPPFGRHAGAALVARGYLRQDQMWPTLRAHAEWVIARTLQTSAGRLVVEPDPPGRLASEPSVFGGATGAEVFVDVVRRVLAPAEAMERLGGPGSRIASGPHAQLLGECALAATEVDRLRAALDGGARSLRELIEGAPEADLATAIFALSLLGVLEVLRGVDAPVEDEDRASAAGVAALDADAVRERVRARLQLVDDGDYFAVLGVPREATGYEVRRAFLELRRAFEPSRVLTPEVADLAGEVRKIVGVLEEAYEILKDAARRERYRRAIEAVPER